MSFRSGLVRFARGEERQSTELEYPFVYFVLLTGGMVMLWSGLLGEAPSTETAAVGAVAILLALLWQIRLVGFARAVKALGAAATGIAIGTLLYIALERLGLSWLVTLLFVPLIAVGIVLFLRDVAD